MQQAANRILGRFRELKNEEVPESRYQVKMDKEKLLVVVGPTAVGKSKVAIELAKRLDGEVISADSMQVYKGMDIGTAKPGPKERRKIRHHLINIVDPPVDFSVAEYQRLARTAIEEITQRGKLPMLVGGSGLYIRSVIDKLKFPSGTLSSKIRRELEKQTKSDPGGLYEELQRLDPKAAKKIHPHNLRRIIRALEVITLTGRTFTEYQKEWQRRESIYEIRIVGLNLPREELYAKIDGRVDEMLQKGLLDEVKTLVSLGYSGAITARQALGYKELLEHLEERKSLEDAVQLIKQRTRNFAKRQLTWFKRDPRIKWFDISDKTTKQVASEIIHFLQTERFLPGGKHWEG